MAQAPTPADTTSRALVVASEPAAAPVLDVAAYQARVYEAPRCWKLVSDVYADLVGQPVDEVQTVSEAMRRAARAFRLELHKGRGGMQQIGQPRDLAVVLMWPSTRERLPHCGIYWQGSVLHATEQATLYQDLASLRDVYPVLEFWAREDEGVAA